VRDRAASGAYNNASEVVREALRPLRRVEEERELQMERLRAAIRATRSIGYRGIHRKDLGRGAEEKVPR